jgi:hypothetical protein
MPPRTILVITGASGSGKTAIVSALASEVLPRVRYHHFDSVGVPDVETMRAQYGSPEAWQVTVCHQWITRLTTAPEDLALEVLEGQVRPATVQEAFRTNRVGKGRVLLLDCSPAVRNTRLHGPRNQPELATGQMTAWAAYLRGQADALHIPTLDTTELSLAEAVARVRQHVTALALAAD